MDPALAWACRGGGTPCGRRSGLAEGRSCNGGRHMALSVSRRFCRHHQAAGRVVQKRDLLFPSAVQPELPGRLEQQTPPLRPFKLRVHAMSRTRVCCASVDWGSLPRQTREAVLTMRCSFAVPVPLGANVHEKHGTRLPGSNWLLPAQTLAPSTVSFGARGRGEEFWCINNF